MDTLWPYRQVVDHLNYILQRLNIAPHASSVTMLSAAEATIMVNTTHYLSDFYQEWNVTTHSWFRSGLQFPLILSRLRDLVELRLTAEYSSFSSGGSSLVALLMPSPTTVISAPDLEYCARFLAGLRRTMPDLNFIFYAGGAVVRFRDLVRNPYTDLFPLERETPAQVASAPVTTRIQRIPRRITNPRCSITWGTNSLGHNRLLQYARPGGINFYRLASNYFFDTYGQRELSVQAVDPVAFTVCTSRSSAWPFRNVSSSPAWMTSSANCSQLITNIYSLDLSNACQGYESATDCPPVFLSVQAQNYVDEARIKCVQQECQAPDQLTYALQLQNMGCNGGRAASLNLGLAALATLILHAIFKQS